MIKAQCIIAALLCCTADVSTGGVIITCMLIVLLSLVRLQNKNTSNPFRSSIAVMYSVLRLYTLYVKLKLIFAFGALFYVLFRQHVYAD
jgi:hypothetical protein